MELFKFITKFFSSWFFVGYLRPVPGTFGALATTPLIFLLKDTSLAIRIIFVFGFTAFAVFFSHLAVKLYGQSDDRRIVIDEVTGFLVTSLFTHFSIVFLTAGFFLFRFFDIIKIFPANKAENLPGGWGVVLDDVCAGAQAGVLIWLAIKIF